MLQCVLLTLTPSGGRGEGGTETISSRKKEGGEKKKARLARPRGPGLKPGTSRVLGGGQGLHATAVCWSSQHFLVYR